MLLNVDEFKNEIGSLTTSNRYRISFVKATQYFSGTLKQNYFMYAKSVQLPNQSIKSAIFNFWGVNRISAGGMDYDNLPVSFIADGKMQLHLGFEKWMGDIYDKDGSYLKYYDDYTDFMYIDIYDQANQIIKRVEVSEVWPKDLGSVDLAYENENQVLMFNVNFQFFKWKTIQIGGNHE